MSTTPDAPEASGNELHADDDAMFDDLARRAGAALRRPAPADGVRLIERQGRRRHALKATVVGAVGAVVVTSLLGVVIVLSSRDAPPQAPVAPAPTTIGAPTFARAIEASGVLTSPSAEDIAQATQDLYRAAPTEMSETGNKVSLWTCRPELSATCGNRVVYLTQTADGVDVHRGVLGDANPALLLLHQLDGRYVVAWESAPDAQAPSQAWLIDAVSGTAGALSWRDEPTTLDSPAQMVLLSGLPTTSALPKVVDARDGTIRPLAMPDDVVAGYAITYGDLDRIWVETDPAGGGFGLASSGDGGATWNDVALPQPLRSQSEDVKVAADDGRVAVTSGSVVYVSDDGGRTWKTATTPSDREGSNNSRLHVLADGRLVLMRAIDNHPKQLLVSTGSDWTELEQVDSVNADGQDLTVSMLWQRGP
jgi:hypothetical protein